MPVLTKKRNRKIIRDNLIYDNKITNSQIFLVDRINKTTETLGRDDALLKAKEQNLNLIQIGVNKEEQSICEILSVEVYIYKLEKKIKGTGKNTASENHMVQIGPFIESFDLERKVKQIKSFLEKKNVVKIIIEKVRLRKRILNISSLIERIEQYGLECSSLNSHTYLVNFKKD